MHRLDRIVIGFLGLVLLLVVFDSLRTPRTPTREDALEQELPCRGDPITVDFPFEWTVSAPHTCAPQCADGKLRYILYSNALATQCETLPGCNDTGEDTGVTCTPPETKPVSATEKKS